MKNLKKHKLILALLFSFFLGASLQAGPMLLLKKDGSFEFRDDDHTEYTPELEAILKQTYEGQRFDRQRESFNRLSDHFETYARNYFTKELSEDDELGAIWASERHRSVYLAVKDLLQYVFYHFWDKEEDVVIFWNSTDDIAPLLFLMHVLKNKQFIKAAKKYWSNLRVYVDRNMLGLGQAHPSLLKGLIPLDSKEEKMERLLKDIEKEFHRHFFSELFGVEELIPEPEETKEGFFIRYHRRLNPEIRTREVALLEEALAQWNRNLEEELAFINDVLVVTHRYLIVPQAVTPIIATPRLLEAPARPTPPRRNFWTQAFSYLTPGSSM
jgi:hypothetical protein